LRCDDHAGARECKPDDAGRAQAGAFLSRPPGACEISPMTHRFALLLVLAICACGMRPHAGRQPPAFIDYGALTWNRIIPDLGAKSPEIAILHVDPKTQGTHLMIRTPAAIHIRRHWHTANETHTLIRGSAVLACDGRRAELGPGGFNFMPAKMVHEAWIAA